MILLNEELPELVVSRLSHSMSSNFALCYLQKTLVALQGRIQHRLSGFSKCRLVFLLIVHQSFKKLIVIRNEISQLQVELLFTSNEHQH